MNKTDKIYVAGHKGLVGSAILRKLVSMGYTNIVARDSGSLDLTDQGAVEAFFAEESPDHVFLAAARVGGILANSTYPAEFIFNNLIIQNNVIHTAYRHQVKKMLFLGSSCIYPKHAPQPMEEACLLTGPLEPTNEPYAIAKIAGIEMCWAYNRQYGTRFLPVMPTNLYGPGDNFNLENAHVLPALMRRCHEARENGADTLTVWGTGTPMREFLHVDDLADACVFLMNLPDETLDSVMPDPQKPLINIGTGTDVTIRELAETICRTVEFTGTLAFDASKPDGTPRKLLDVSRLKSLGWAAETDLATGIRNTYTWFLENESGIRT